MLKKKREQCRERERERNVCVRESEKVAYSSNCMQFTLVSLLFKNSYRALDYFENK